MVSLKYYKGVIENANKRPCYFCFKSKKYDNIIWFIPVSTKIKKYQNILICETHPSYVYVYKKRELNQYIKNLEKKIMNQITRKE